MIEEQITLTEDQLKALQIAFEQLKPLFGLLDNTARRCDWCNEVFLPSEPKNRFCSKMCQKAHWNDNRSSKSLKNVQEVAETVKCNVTDCNNEFIFDKTIEMPYRCRECYSRSAR